MIDEISNNNVDKGFRVILTIFSGRTNPQWMIVDGPDYEKLIRLIKGLKTSKDSPFIYSEWNQLGYASFWIIPKNIEGMPDAIHIWRDMVYILLNKENEEKYALGATEIYNLLVAQAEERDLGAYFVNYREYREKLRPERKASTD
jgi:hypothetical protein